MFHMNNYAWVWSLLLAVFMLSACSTVPSVSSRQLAATLMSTEAGWSKQVLQTSNFDLLSYVPPSKAVETLTIYIEGDGLAWINRNTISSDPTPINPLALSLALADTTSNAVYLARPCQYVLSPYCESRFWTAARFSIEVVNAMNDAVNQLKTKFNAKQLRLVGYSGGGAIATLVAAQRDDVNELITIAGNLDHVAWTQHHRISPLTDSLNPIDFVDNLLSLNQTHYVGEQDKVIPIEVAQSYVDAYPDEHKPKLKRIANMSHGCCWAQSWPRLLMSIEKN